MIITKCICLIIYLVSEGLNINCPLMCMTIFFSLLTKITSNVSIDNWLDDGDSLKKQKNKSWNINSYCVVIQRFDLDNQQGKRISIAKRFDKLGIIFHTAQFTTTFVIIGKMFKTGNELGKWYFTSVIWWISGMVNGVGEIMFPYKQTIIEFCEGIKFYSSFSSQEILLHTM